MNKETRLLANMLQCGYADVNYFCQLLEDFNIEYDELDLDQFDGQPNLNDLIYIVFEISCSRHNISQERYSIFTNCLDSHLCIDGEEMYNESDVEAKAQTEAEE